MKPEAFKELKQLILDEIALRKQYRTHNKRCEE